MLCFGYSVLFLTENLPSASLFTRLPRHVRIDSNQAPSRSLLTRELEDDELVLVAKFQFLEDLQALLIDCNTGRLLRIKGSD
jgi:hypothetical protein